MGQRKEKVRIGLLGCGRASEYLHLPTLERLPIVDLVSIAETDVARQTELSNRLPDVEVFSSYAELLDHSEVDAVVVALPNELHAPAAIDSFEKGLHVYAEKPLANSLDEAKKIMSAWKVSGRVGMVGFNYRFGQQQIDARQCIQNGELGKIVAIQSLFSTQARELPDWKRHRSSGGGSLLDLSSHHLDLICWLLDRRPAKVQCTLASVRTEHDSAAVQLEFADGLIAQILSSFTAGENDRIEVLGDSGKVIIDRYRHSRLSQHPADLAGVRLNQFVQASRALSSPSYWRRKFSGAGPEVSYERSLSEFADAVLNGREASPDIANGYSTMQLTSAAELAAKTGETVDFHDFVDANSPGK